MKKHILVAGGGGFIGGFLVKRLLDEGNKVTVADIKPKSEWYQVFDKCKNHDLCDLQLLVKCQQVCRKVDEVYNLACFNDQTEVWTKSGWKLFKDVSFEDEIATLSKYGYLEWQSPTKFCSYPYKGKMFNFSSQKIDLCVTPNHKMYVKKPSHREFILLDAEKCNLVQLKMKKGLKWNGMKNDFIEIPLLDKMHHNTKKTNKFPIKPFLKFLGYYLSEGSCHANVKKGTYRIHLSNKNSKIISDMKICVEEMGFTPYFDQSSSHGISFQSKILLNWLNQFGLCTEKFIPQNIKDLSSDLLQIIFDSLFAGDGTKGRGTYNTTSKRLADDFGELCLKLGYSYTISFNESKNENWNHRYYIYFSKNIQ